LPIGHWLIFHLQKPEKARLKRVFGRAEPAGK
jgi:hypothetical protein